MLTGVKMSAALGGWRSRVLTLRPPGVTRPLRGSLPLRSPGGGRRLSDTRTGAELRPLEGVRVLDLTRVLAGPFATMILGDLGAEVIKVERPGPGDDTRAWGPPFVGTESAYYLSINRNKKSISVDLKHPRGAGIIQELAAVCDVLIENYLPGKLDQMGLGYEQLRGVNPELIYCSISGYGQTGPQASSPGYDSIASAVSGMMHITGPEDGEPVRPGVAMTDLATGLYAHGAVMAALLQRHKTRTGVHIDCNLLSSQGFRTKDGHIVVAAGNDKQFVKVCQVLKLVELTDEPKYKTNKLRVQNRKELLHTLSQRFLQEKTADWLRRFEGSGVPVGPINSIQEVFSDPQVKHNRLILEMNHPTAGRIRVPGPAVRFSSFAHGEPMPPPLIGQHTVQVLRHTLSYSDDVIKTLLESRVVAQNEVS
ncbi:succinate--hydroxymethylglutarate CoA-transferase isoform X2 [Acanthopagrus latus]|uniref:succinate--hydroxymethylglutarate CoA-transferase isoform X2 n=1 Tax=Acanthopagrus latus TaxID=8177 RepID=UPI00187C80E3|nr:succinate--hydroxymethylglutarate CoA-transferase isoform X2 [Acanthopagrus latus]